jgi:transposase
VLIASPSQGEYMSRVREVDRDRYLLVPVDVGKRSAMALVADHCHDVVVAPFEFDLTESGVATLLRVVDGIASRRCAPMVRFGVGGSRPLSPGTGDSTR